MAYIVCRKHGAQPADLVTKNVIEIVAAENFNQATEIRPITLVYEYIEYPVFATNADFLNFELTGATRKQDDVIEFSTEDAMENALGLLQPVCIKCLFLAR
jgi:hypothetical protein